MKLAIAALIPCAVFLAVSSGAEQKFKAGAILPLSGEFAAYGSTCQNAINLAQEDAGPEAGGKLEILFEDDMLVPRESVDAFRKLTSVNKIGAVITFTSGCSNAVAPLAENMRMPMVAIAASDPKVVEGREFISSLWVSPAVEARMAFSEALRRGYKRIARVTAMQDGMLALKHDFDAINKGHIDVVLDEDFPGNMRDFRSYIARLRNQSDLDAIFLLLLPGQNGMFAKQLRQAGVTQQIFNVETIENVEDVDSAEGALLGAWYVQTDDPQADFMKRFLEKYPDSSLYGAAACYDAVRMIADAVKRKIPVEKYLDGVKDFKGAEGTFSGTGNGHFTLSAIIKVVGEEGFEKQAEQPKIYIPPKPVKKEKDGKEAAAAEKKPKK